MAIPFLNISSNKPHRLKTKDKNSEYHVEYARWAIGEGFGNKHEDWLKRININKRFYMNDSWVMDEDLQAFLKDTSGNVRNRIKIRFNQIRPMVEQFRGNASMLKISAGLHSVSPMARNRREQRLSEKIFKNRLIQEFPWLAQGIQSKDPAVGKDEADTVMMFENLYVDQYIRDMNGLLKYSAHLNNFEQKQMRVALNLALTGLTVGECFAHGGHYRYELVEPEDFFFDHDARKNDLTDASFMGYASPMEPSFILEKWQVDGNDAMIIESAASNSNGNNMFMDNSSTRYFSQARIPVFKVYWKDVEKYEYAYVMDEDGYPYLTKINYTYSGEEKPRYTDKDIIDPPKSSRNEKLFGTKKKRFLFVDIVRFCEFIPGEYLGKSEEKRDVYDVVLDYGYAYDQEHDCLDLNNVLFPIKCQTWGYMDGEIFSPVDDVIDPQRFINRVLSVTEQLINSSGGSNVILDEDAIGPDGVDSAYRDIAEGNPLTVRTRGKGVPNAVGYYDATPKPGVHQMFNVVPVIKQMITDTTGINEALRGESTGSDQLVGVTEMLMQRGSLMQEPFYAAMRDFFMQWYQNVATSAKRFYCENERELAIIAGDEGASVIRLSKDLKNEDFRVFVEQENNDQYQIGQANQMLTTFLQFQLIDDVSYANAYGRSTPNDVALLLRSQAGIRAEMRRQQAMEAQQQAQATMQQQQQYAERERQDNINAQNQQAAMEMNRQNTDLDKALIAADSKMQKPI